MRIAALLAGLLVLAACGIDGPPSAPGPAPTVSGEARIGVVGEL